MMTQYEKDVVINKVCCRILQRVCQSVSDTNPIMPGANGKYSFQTVMEQARLEYNDGVRPYQHRRTEEDDNQMLSIIQRDLIAFVGMLNKY